MRLRRVPLLHGELAANMADILALLSSARAVESVRRAVQMEVVSGVSHELHLPGSWRELLDLAGRSMLGIAVVDPYHSGFFALSEIRLLRTRFPRLETIAYADFSGRPAREPFTLGFLGVRDLISPGAGDDPAHIRQCLADHLNWTPFEALVDRASATVPCRMRSWFAAVLRSAVFPRTVAELAETAHCSPRTLRRNLSRAQLPSPEEILTWRRLLHAVRLMEDANRSVESVARALDYSSGSALRKSLKRVTGLRPREVINRGGFLLLGELFLQRCRSPTHGGSPAVRVACPHPEPPP